MTSGMPASRSASKPGADGQAGDRVERVVASRVDAELRDDVERGVPAGQLDDVGLVVDRLEGRVPGLPS